VLAMQANEKTECLPTVEAVFLFAGNGLSMTGCEEPVKLKNRCRNPKGKTNPAQYQSLAWLKNHDTEHIVSSGSGEARRTGGTDIWNTWKLSKRGQLDQGVGGECDLYTRHGSKACET